MPHLVALALAGAGLYAGYRWVARQLDRVAAEAERAETEMRRRASEITGEPLDLGNLVWDEKAGVYRPGR
jgi:hypothetical protein